MRKYKVIKCKVKDAEENMNELAKLGWRVVAVCPNIAVGYGVVITFEKDEDSSF